VQDEERADDELGAGDVLPGHHAEEALDLSGGYGLALELVDGVERLLDVGVPGESHRAPICRPG
jgi:hypothetical protein